MAERKPAENRHRGSSLDDFLAEEGVLREFQARAIEEVIALAEAMKERGGERARRRLAAPPPPASRYSSVGVDYGDGLR